MTPIDVNDLMEKGTEVKAVKSRHAQDSVLKYLSKNSDHAYTQGELGEALKMRPQQVRQCCVALEKKGLTVRKQVDIQTDKGTEPRIFWAILQE